MFFNILNRFGHLPTLERNSRVFLIWDDWNDFSYHTLFGIFYIDAAGTRHDLGSIKIGFYGQLQEEKKKLRVGDSFNKIDSQHFSVGLDDNYYETLNRLGDVIRDKILFGLNDIAKNNAILDKALEEPVFQVSFLRGLSQSTIEGQFRRLSDGVSRRTPYNFTFTTPVVDENNSFVLSFEVQPKLNPPTNIHIVIGRNGVGKTFMIHNMIDSLSKRRVPGRNYGSFEFEVDEDVDIEENSYFANLICVTFSAFDEFSHPQETVNKLNLIQYVYIGLKSEETDLVNEKGSLLNLDLEFFKSLFNIKLASKSIRWKHAIKMLESDPEFRAKNISTLIDVTLKEGVVPEEEMKNRSLALFKTLSSGHKLVLLTITRLVEKLEERSLLLIDEPESHLHPPLLSSFMRTLTQLLIDRNAVCIIATHSPVVLQEVPKQCVWKLRRNGNVTIVERLPIETFGENVGVLTEEVFGLEVTDSGFHSILRSLVESCSTYEEALENLKDQLGLEGKAILRGLFFQKKKQNDSN